MEVVIAVNLENGKEKHWASAYADILEEINIRIKAKQSNFVEPKICVTSLAINCSHDFVVVGMLSNQTLEIRCMKCRESFNVSPTLTHK